MRTLALGTLVLLAYAACAGSAPPPAHTAPVESPSVVATDVDAGATGRDRRTLVRSAVRAVVAQGLGAFLQHVELDDQPVRSGGKFRGFRIASLKDPQFWSGVDLRPGDVVTRVNGLPIERPEQAQTAFESLETASELRVSYDREGEARELVYAIADDR
jgi:type II secretion system protein C